MFSADGQQKKWILYFPDSNAYPADEALGEYDWIRVDPVHWYYETSKALADQLGPVCRCAQTGDNKGTFGGHDQVNDFESTLHGIRPSYGRATGFSAYGRESLPRAGRVLLIEADKTTAPVRLCLKRRAQVQY